MAGSSTFSPAPVPLARTSVPIAIFLYDPTQSTASDKWQLQPQLRLLSIEQQEGPNPHVARFRYAFAAPYRDPEDPQSVEAVYPLDATGLRVIKQDDRLVVAGIHDDGTYMLLFSGFVQAPQGDLGSETETVTFAALCDAVREFDVKLSGAVFRDGDHPETPDGDTAAASAAIRFNPDDEPNASPSGAAAGAPAIWDSGEDPNKYPVFLGPAPPRGQINGQDLRLWTLPMAARYLFNVGPLRDDGKGNMKPSPYVTFSDLSPLDTRLKSIVPIDAQTAGQEPGPVDTTDPSTFTLEDLEVQDTDVTGMAWPAALWRVIEPYGFGMNYVLVEGEPTDDGYPGDPHYEIDIYRKDYTARVKSLTRQKAGNQLDPGKTNLQGLSLSRDGTRVENRVDIDAAPVRVEAGWVLAAGFHVDNTDIDNLEQFIRGEEGFQSDRYRTWIFDECGEGHWDFSEEDTVTDVGDFSPAFLPLRKGADGKDAVKRYWAIRYRKGESECISLDENGDPERATLFLSYDYAGTQPGVWDGTGTWQEVISGQWRLLDDRLGVFLTPKDINSFDIGFKQTGSDVEPAGKVSIVDRCNGSSADNPPIFMVCCPVDTDDDFNVSAARRASSPTSFEVNRRIDARERFKKQVVSRWSKFALAANVKVKDKVARDDTEDAQWVADAFRRETEQGVYAGPARIPRLTTAYSVGDMIKSVDGRGISLRTNGATEQGESPVYPCVQAITWNFDGEQSTELNLSDVRPAPPPRKRTRVGGRGNRQ